MNILVIEDDFDFSEALSGIINKEATESQLTLITHLSGAMQEIQNSFFDLIILDLNIPVDEGTLDGAPSHGHSAFRTARLAAPGTPVIVLTGSSAEDFIESMLSMSEKKDVWGSGTEVQLVDFHQKHKLDSFPLKLREYTNNIRALRDIELQRNGVDLSKEEDRILRIFSRSVDGVFGSLSKIGGGLSGSKVFRLEVKAENGSLVHDAVCKIGPIQSIKDEDQRYTRHIARLKPEATPRKLAILEHGAKDTAGVFYSLADGFMQNAFSQPVMATMSVSLVSCLENLMASWQTEAQKRLTIGEVRRRVVSDETMLQLKGKYNLQWVSDFESQKIQVRWGCAHGDMHGLNILVSHDGVPIVIDYGDTDEGPSSLDPITLEFSIFFHPDGPLKNSTWPSDEQAKNWGNLAAYLVNCPFPNFVESCRNWAVKIAAGEREVAVVGYAYFLRQLKYDEVNHKRALLFLEGAREYYSNT